MTAHCIEMVTTNTQDQIALRGIRLEATLRGMSLKATLDQVFTNKENQAIEAVYTFPLPESAAICGFEVRTGDRIITGQIEEREHAIELHEENISQGHGSYLLEQERPDVFSVRVGNLKPQQSAAVRLSYVSSLEIADRSVRLSFPTTVAPRYVTSTGSDPHVMAIDGDALNPPHLLSVPYGLTMDLTIDLGREIKRIESTSHVIKVTDLGGNRYSVTFAGAAADMDRDVILQLELAADPQPLVQSAKGPDGANYLAMTFVPDFELDDAPNRLPADLAFVIDCSGSMQGDSIGQAKTALELCLRSLAIGDRFNICRFGSRFEMMSPEPLVYSPKTLEEAVRYVRHTSANLGGTEILPPLQQVLKQDSAGPVRQIIVLTDGEVSNEAAVISLAREHRAANRIFSFGIGYSPSATLVKGLARVTAGASEFISAGEDIAAKVLRTFGRVESPAITEVKADWGTANVLLGTSELPPIFDGDALTLLARVDGAVPEQMTLMATTPAGVRTWRVHTAGSTSDDLIATMWARQRIQSLEDASDVRHPRRNAEKTLVDLSKQFGLICSQTAYIAVEHRTLEERNDGRPAIRRVPIVLAHGWHGAGGMADVVAGAAAPRMRSMLDVALDRSIDRLADSAPASPSQHPGLFRSVMSSLGGIRAKAAVKAKAPARNELHEILAGQSAEGWFDRTDVAAVRSGDAQVKWSMGQAAGQLHVTSSAADHLESTIEALLILQILFATESAIWRRAFDKAVRWLAKVTGQSVAEVEKLLKP